MDNFAGTGLEEALIQFISARLGDLKSKYDVHLIRNEEVFKLNNFADGGRIYAGLYFIAER